MASLADEPTVASPADDPRSAVARAFLDCLAVQDFERLASVFSDDVHLRALLPAEFKEWEGVEKVTRTFSRWFGDTQEFELVDVAVSEIGPRLYLQWRARVRAERLGKGWFVVEQEAYADTDAEDRIRHLSLLCSGYLAETPER